MNKYVVQTGIDKITDNLLPGKISEYPQFKGDVEVLAINEDIGKLSLVNITDCFLLEVVKEISAKSEEGTRLLPKSNIPYLGIMNLIAN